MVEFPAWVYTGVTRYEWDRPPHKRYFYPNLAEYLHKG